MEHTSPSIRALVAAFLSTLLAHAPAARADTDLRGVAVGPKGPPIVLAGPKDFKAAVAVIEKATGAQGEKLPGDVPLAVGRSFALEPSLAERLLEGSHRTFRKAGLYLFRYERSFGMAGDKDLIGLLDTSDANAVIRRIGTAGSHHGLTAEKVIAWLDGLAKDEPFDLWEVGVDYVAGRFEKTPKDPMGVAKRCAEFAPDLVAGRASTLDLLASEIKANRTLYLIW